uniref:DNA-directed RNA polymerase subunit beta n=1 Tax=Lygus hesperus TaxID=30085 RepID=A0A0A9X3A0_LYGHE
MLGNDSKRPPTSLVNSTARPGSNPQQNFLQMSPRLPAKLWLFCTLLCLHCGGTNCENGKTWSVDDDEDSVSEEEDDPPTLEAEELREALSPLTIMVEECLSSSELKQDVAAQSSTSASQPKRRRLQ